MIVQSIIFHSEPVRGQNQQETEQFLSETSCQSNHIGTEIKWDEFRLLAYKCCKKLYHHFFCFILTFLIQLV